MDGVHDMGGMHGFGPIERDELSYHEDWEVRVHGISSALAAPGGGRFSLESLEPAIYLGSSYYERWLQARINTLLAAEIMTHQEFDDAVAHYRANPEAAPPADDPARYEEAREAMAAKRRQAPDAVRPELSQNPGFAVGDRVVAKTAHPEGHTRLPRYVRGRSGEVIAGYRRQGFQDDEPMGDQAGLQFVYAVRFDGQELWGDQAERNSSVVLDMWEAYIEAVK